MLKMAIYGCGDCMLKKKVNGSWQNITTLKKKVNGSWSDCSTVQKKYNGAWSIVWQRWNARFTAYARTSSTASYSYLATTTANDNMLMKLYNRQSSDNGQLDVTTYNGSAYAFQLRVGETIYVDYVYTQSGNCYEASILINDLGYSVNSTLLNGLTSNASGTVSYTPTINFSGYLTFKVYKTPSSDNAEN